MNNKIYLSYLLDENTPTYGNRNKFEVEKKSNIKNGDIVNDSFIKTTVHIGTHIDMPYHFYENGQTIEDFDIDYFIFDKILFVEIEPKELIINKKLKEKLSFINNKDSFEAIIVKTGICYKREEKSFWEQNYGFDPSLANFIRKNFPNVRVFGFDSISVSSFQNRLTGRESHKQFLNPEEPILLIEDMDLRNINSDNDIKKMIVSPLRISKCDGLPCTIIGEIK